MNISNVDKESSSDVISFAHFMSKQGFEVGTRFTWNEDLQQHVHMACLRHLGSKNSSGSAVYVGWSHKFSYALYEATMKAYRGHFGGK